MDNLSNRATLVSLKIKNWAGTVVDKKVSEQVLYENQASDEAGSFRKRLMPKDAMKPISAVLNEVRKYVKTKTLAWEDGKQRLLAASLITEFTDTLREHEVSLENAVTDFIACYGEYKEAAKDILNGLYIEGDYPPESELREKFSLKYEFQNISDPDDFRCTISNDLKEKIQNDMKSTIDQKYAGSMKKLYERVYTVVSKFNEKLSDEDATFNKSLINNIEDLVSVLPALNIMEDSKLSALTTQIQTEICKFNPLDLRKDKEIRKDAVQASSQILASLEEMYT